MSTMPPPMDSDDLTAPPDLDFRMPENWFPNDQFLEDSDAYQEDHDPFERFHPPTREAVEIAGKPYSSDTPHDGWSWHDAALIAVGRVLPDGETEQYSIGAVDLYVDTRTGTIGGRYLEMGTFDDLEEAAAYYHELRSDMHTRELLPFELPEYATHRAAKRAEQGETVPQWRAATDLEYAIYDEMRSLQARQSPDVPPDQLQLETLLGDETLHTPTSPEPDDVAAFHALRDIGIVGDGFNPTTDPPPFVDPETGTAYWIGVFQPDKHDPSNCVTSILSLARDSQTGEVEAQLAPCVPGEWDKAYGAAEYLLGIVEKGGIERAFEAAEGMALASDQHELWERERGIRLEADAAQDLANYTRDQWEIEL